MTVTPNITRTSREHERDVTALSRSYAHGSPRARLGAKDGDGEQEQERDVSQSVARPPRAPAHTRPPLDPDLLERARRAATSATPDLQLDLRADQLVEPPRRTATDPWTDCELRRITNHRLREACNAGQPPQNIRAWLAAAALTELENEKAKPGWIRRTAAGLAAAADGKRVTGWTWQRGTHSGSYERDPYGTDGPPPRGTT